MYDKLVKEIQKKAYFAKHKKVLIAVSGGVDSIPKKIRYRNWDCSCQSQTTC